jgi:hypothetical protein
VTFGLRRCNVFHDAVVTLLVIVCRRRRSITNPFIAQIFATSESSWFDGSPVDAFGTGVVILAKLMRFLGRKASYSANENGITASGGPVSSFYKTDGHICSKWRNNFSSKKDALGSAMDEIILEGTKWEDTCFVISCEGQTNCDSVMMEIFVQ